MKRSARGAATMTRRRIRLIKAALFVACLLPFTILVLGALGLGPSLGANPVEKIQDTLGQWGLRLLVITLAVTPLRYWLEAPWLIQLRRMLGLYAFFYVLMHFLTWLVLDQGLLWRAVLARISHDSTAFVGERWTCV